MSQVIEPRSASTPSMPPAASPSRWQDWFGIVASIGCAIHCAAMPFVISFLPALGLSFLADAAFHRWMALACFVIALAAFVPGFRQHRRWMPAGIAVVGISLITFAAFGFAGDCCAACELPDSSSVSAAVCTDACCELCATDAVTEQQSPDVSTAGIAMASFMSPELLVRLAPWITPLGGLLLVSAHLLNRRYGCLCGCCEAKPSAEATA
ncbi:MerC mercury resistance protein [Rubripirellula tenax]|uniref:MerC mercury resistance protein n=1 Tax=Rubripirellula tenax TaxID=2528015 RepID=A0A5C6F050_9BACT|nr:MerC domain-containing protein [Rubripirellula tenax]TWU54758.1 MerC mercury resistance protein [Rubripirellula tenax]